MIDLFRRNRIPNLITLGRLLSVPAIILCMIADASGVALCLFAFFGLSDFLDGYLARRWGATSDFGATLDPIADKFLIAAMGLALVFEDLIPLWFLYVILGRDILILSFMGLFLLLKKEITPQPSLLSKVNTLVQILYLMLVLLEKNMGTTITFSGVSIHKIGISTVVFFTLISGTDYALKAFQILLKKETS